eukprot:766078-Hanusia_phi.AAC.4
MVGSHAVISQLDSLTSPRQVELLIQAGARVNVTNRDWPSDLYLLPPSLVLRPAQLRPQLHPSSYLPSLSCSFTFVSPRFLCSAYRPRRRSDPDRQHHAQKALIRLLGLRFPHQDGKMAHPKPENQQQDEQEH